MHKLRKAAVVTAVLGSVSLLGAGTANACGVANPSDSNHQQMSRSDYDRQEPTRSDSERQQPSREDASRQEVTRDDISRQEAPREDSSRQEPTSSDSNRQQQLSPTEASRQQQQLSPSDANRQQQQLSPSDASRQQAATSAVVRPQASGETARLQAGGGERDHLSTVCKSNDKNVDNYGEVGFGNGTSGKSDDNAGDPGSQTTQIGSSMNCSNSVDNSNEK
ncbi:hypothetical protein ACFY12_26420 [Streptomyces sp. NPDC001339]|uniref:hypothetical protein n=1 Tax=Streptomyces sp. NPDC001339 TaxID=3364563 RepID=UPI0036B26A2D